MKNYRIKNILLLLLAAVVMNCFNDIASLEKLRQEFNKDLLSDSEKTLLEKFNNQKENSNAALIIEDNKFQFRSIFYKLMQRGIFFRLDNKTFFVL